MQALLQELTKLQTNMDREMVEVRPVPAHHVNVKMGNPHQVLIGGGKSFGPSAMVQILSRAGLLDNKKEGDAPLSRFQSAQLQHMTKVWDIMRRYESARPVCMQLCVYLRCASGPRVYV